MIELSLKYWKRWCVTKRRYWSEANAAISFRRFHPLFTPLSEINTLFATCRSTTRLQTGRLSMVEPAGTGWVRKDSNLGPSGYPDTRCTALGAVPRGLTTALSGQPGRSARLNYVPAEWYRSFQAQTSTGFDLNSVIGHLPHSRPVYS